MQLMSKPIDFMTSSVLVLCVHVVVVTYATTRRVEPKNFWYYYFSLLLITPRQMQLQLMTNMIFIENVDEMQIMSSNFGCDNVFVFASTNERFFNCNSIFFHMNKET